jgi:hypothetical protein
MANLQHRTTPLAPCPAIAPATRPRPDPIRLR